MLSSPPDATASPKVPLQPTRLRSGWPDLLGLALAVALGSWALLAASRVEDARPMPVVALLGAAVAATGAGRWAGRSFPILGPAALAVGIAGVLVSALPSLAQAAGSPLGYANANATFAGLGTLAALGAAVGAGLQGAGRAEASGPTRSQHRPWLVPLLVVAGGLGALVLVPESVASALALATAVLLAGAALWRGTSRLAVAGGAGIVLAVLLATVVVAFGADPANVGTRTEARGELWAGALELAGDHPAFGIGPGRFAELNPVTDDDDLRWAHHSYLHSAAELGIPGLLLVLGLVSWSYWRLWTVSAPTGGSGSTSGLRPTATVAVGAGAVTLVALHSAVDYTLHFPEIVLVAAALFGWSTARPSS